MAQWGEYDCRHRICITCATRLIFLYRTGSCPLCKQDTKRVVYSSGADGTPLVLNTATAEVVFSTSGLKQRVDGLLQNKCQLCEKKYGTVAQLRNHYREHAAVLCNECVEGLRYFWYEHRLYRADTIKQHRDGRLRESGFDGHVYCTHCGIYLFDSAAAKQHCIEKHEVCSVCTLLGIRHHYYNTFRDLEAHYRQAHYCCPQELCQSKKCYVFAHRTELLEHLMKCHRLSKQIADVMDPKKCTIQYMDPYSGPSNSLTVLNNRSHIYREPDASQQAPGAQDTGLPRYLDRSVLAEERAREKRRRYWIERVCGDSCNEVEAIVNSFMSDEVLVPVMFDHVSGLIGDKATLSLMESLKFGSKQASVNVHLKGFKNKVMFPKFKPSSPVEYEEAPRQKEFGFKIIDMGKRR
jgi:E3 ubiquitin-protein ligase ZNF598